ncbi:MAG: amino acid permease [Euryarchaeota archaeon]|mgnify:CR=1 FL=1|nr:amino acid permease [Euryarchaeota archaeon]
MSGLTHTSEMDDGGDAGGTGLERGVGLFGAVSYGVGTIVGAGVYALMGPGVANAGNAVWLAFVIAAIIASFTGLCYAKLASICPTAGAEYDYVGGATNSRFWSFVVGWLVILSAVISMAAVALGFGGYLQALTNMPATLFAAILIIAMSIVNFRGIRESVIANIILTTIGVAGVVITILLGAESLGNVDYFEIPKGMNGLIGAVGVIFFAFIGFEGLVKIGEETKDPTKTIPRALLLSIVISTSLYVMAALSVVSVVPHGELAGSTSALADVARVAGGPELGLAMTLIALTSTSSTVLVLSISTSRIAYGMSVRSALPAVFSKIHPREKTPHIAILISSILALLFCAVGDIEFVANVANYTIFMVFLAVDLALLILWRKGIIEEIWFALAGILGVITSLIMLTQFDLKVTLLSLTGAILGMLAYRFFSPYLRPGAIPP